MVQRIFPPVRPMEPAYIGRFLSAKKMDRKLIAGYKKALSAYHTKCNKAVDDLEKALDGILKKL